MDELNQIPWKNLTHAYGSAEDVPDLLRTLKTAPPNLRGEDSPLWHLFGNIWHQGTVYEATAYAVPFLIEIAADRQASDRCGVLGLLAEIARGTSFSDVHGNLGRKADFEEKIQRELGWVNDAHQAVAKGFSAFIEMTKENSDVRLAAAHVLAQLREFAPEVAAILRAMLAAESHPISRAGILFLFGEAGDRSDQTLGVLSTAAHHEETNQRSAAAVSLIRLRALPPKYGTYESLVEVFYTNDLEKNFEALPWDACGEINRDALLDLLDKASKDQIYSRLIGAIDSGDFTVSRTTTLINLLFPYPKPGRIAAKVTATDLSSQQRRAVQAMVKLMEAGKRIFYSSFLSHGLPETVREWRALAAGREPEPVDQTLPLLASPRRPRKPLRPAQAASGRQGRSPKLRERDRPEG